MVIEICKECKTDAKREGKLGVIPRGPDSVCFQEPISVTKTAQRWEAWRADKHTRRRVQREAVD